MDERVLEMAEELTASEVNNGVASVRSRLAPQTHPDFDGKHCVDEMCGEEIPKARLDMGRIRCTECESRLEKLNKVGIRP